MATYRSTSKNLIIATDKTVIKFAGGIYETTDKSKIKIIEHFAKAIPEVNIKEIKGNE